MTLRKEETYHGLNRPACLVLASLAVVFLIWFLNPPNVSGVSVDFPADPSQRLENVSLPLSRQSTPESSSFTVTAKINHTNFSSGQLNIEYDDCLEAIQVNGVEVSKVKNMGKSRRCRWWLAPLTVDLRPYLALGPNTVRIDITDRGGKYRINVTGIYTLAALYGMVVAFGLALYVGLFVLLDRSSLSASRRMIVNGRMQKVAFLPGMGLLYLWAVQANGHETKWIDDHGLSILAALTLSLAFLIRALDKHAAEPLPLKFSECTAIVSIGGFAYSSMLIPINGWISPEAILYAVIGTVAGFLTFVPALPVIRRPLGIALLAAMCPTAYWTLNLPFWVQISGVTTTMVRGILWTCGFLTTTFTQEKKGEQGQLTDYHAYVSSSDFSIQIGAGCSGLEGVSLFIFLLSVFVLLDWDLFSKVKHLWAMYVVTTTFILIVNAMRIAGLFLYAEWYIWMYNREAAGWATVEAFHSNIGWVIYIVAFALLLPLLYRWAEHDAKVR